MSALVKGDRVRLSPEGRQQFSNGRWIGRCGTVVGLGLYANILWDGNKAASGFHPDFIEKIEPLPDPPVSP